MAISDISIYNSALIKIGADIISSTTQDTRSANLINKIYGLKRDEVQSSRPWSFTLNRYTLAPKSTVPTFGWDNTFDLPNSWLAVWEVNSSGSIDGLEDTDYRVEQNTIVSDEDTLDVVLGISNTDPSTWSHLFAEALAWRIATEISIALKQSENLMMMCDKKYQEILAQASWKNSLDNPSRVLVADKWTNSRL